MTGWSALAAAKPGFGRSAAVQPVGVGSRVPMDQQKNRKVCPRIGEVLRREPHVRVEASEVAVVVGDGDLRDGAVRVLFDRASTATAGVAAAPDVDGRIGREPGELRHVVVVGETVLTASAAVPTPNTKNRKTNTQRQTLWLRHSRTAMMRQLTAIAAIVMIGPHPTRGIFASTSVTPTSSHLTPSSHRLGSRYRPDGANQRQSPPNRYLPVPPRPNASDEILATGIPVGGALAR